MEETAAVRPPRASLVVLVLVGTFSALALLVLLLGDLPGEQRLLRTASSIETLRPVALLIDRWTGYVPVVLAAAPLVVVLACTRRRRVAIATVFCVGGAVAGNTLLKRVIGRDRPDLLPAGADVSGLSFPSGHAAATATLALVVVLLLAATRWAVPAVIGAATVVVLAGAAQLVLAQHHPSDVVGGWLWAGAWTTAVWSAFGTRPLGDRGLSRRAAERLQRHPL